jgi:hypothetical protein
MILVAAEIESFLPLFISRDRTSRDWPREVYSNASDDLLDQMSDAAEAASRIILDWQDVANFPVLLFLLGNPDLRCNTTYFIEKTCDEFYPILIRESDIRCSKTKINPKISPGKCNTAYFRR